MPYCHHCGKETQLSWKACPYCTTSLTSLASTPAKVNVTNVNYNNRPTVVQANGEDDEDSDTNYLDRQQNYQPKITALAVEFEQIKPNTNKLADFVTNPFLSVDNTPRNAPPINKEQFQKDWQNEAGNKPRSNTDIDTGK